MSSAGIFLTSRHCGDAISVLQALVLHVWLPNAILQGRNAVNVLAMDGLNMQGTSANASCVNEKTMQRCMPSSSVDMVQLVFGTGIKQ